MIPFLPFFSNLSGNLFIKPLPSSEDEDKKKFSLLVRADTNLGNILLNISLASLKFNKMGAKDISFLCVPNPLPDPKMPADAPSSCCSESRIRTFETKFSNSSILTLEAFCE